MEAPALAATAGGSIATSISRSPSLHHQHQHQHQPPPPSSSQQPVHKRPRLGASNDSCSTCRLRKIKCPGRPGGEHGVPCDKCAKASVKCGFVGDGGGKVSRVTPTQDLTEAGTRRKRAQRACEACHSHKTKCSGDFPKCKRCLEHGLMCEYKASRRKFASSSAASPNSALHPTPTATVAPRALPPGVTAEAKQLVSPSASSVSPALTDSTRAPSMGNVLISEDILARSDLLLRHFDVWFDAWARLPLLAVLHPEETYAGIREKTLNPNIARCICAITTRFIYPGSINMPEFAERCAEDVDQHIVKHIGSFLNEGDGLDNLVILIITVCYFWIEGSMGKVWMYMGLAGRLITALQLNWEGAGESPVRQEIIRRAVWTIWKLDRYLANGFDEHLVLRDDVMHLKVPSTDQGFPEESDTIVAAASPHTAQPLEKPLCAYLVAVYRMKHLILGITKKLADSPTSHPRMARPETSHFLKQVVQLQSRLLHFNQSLPAQLKVSDTSVIERWVNTTDCGSFIMLYTVFWELYVDLYRFSIPGLREEASAEFAKQLPPDFVEKSQKQAVGYAVSLSQFWRAAQAVASSRSWVNGRERLLTVDQTLILHVIQVTKVLLAARQHRLYDNLEELSSAPLLTKEPINDDTLMALVQSNLKIFDGFAVFFPITIETHTRDLRLAVDGIHNNIPYDNPRETIGLPARKAPENIRLPGPHYMLEQAIAPPDSIPHDRQHPNVSKADDFLRSKRQSPRRDSISSATELSQPGQRPEIPIWLASARMAPPAPSRTQSTPHRSPTGRPPPDGGPGGPHQHLYTRAGSWSTPGPTYSAGSSVSPLPLPPPTNQHSYMNPIFGLGGTHDTHPGFYHRAGGKTLPFPDIDSIM